MDTVEKVNRRLSEKFVSLKERGFNLLTQLKDHTKAVRSVAFSPDNTKLASASDDYTVCVYDAETFELLTQLKDHTDDARSVAFSPDNTKLASASYFGTVCVHDAKTFELLTQLEYLTTTFSVAFSPDGTKLAASGVRYERDELRDFATVIVFDTETFKPLTQLRPHSDTTFCQVAFSPDGTQLVSSVHNEVCAYDAETFKLLNRLDGLDINPSVAFSPDSTKLAMAFPTHNKVCVYNAKTLQLITECKKTFQFFNGDDFHEVEINITEVTFSPDGTKLAALTGGSAVRVYDTERYKLQSWYDVLSGYEVNSFAFSPNGTKLVSGAGDGTVCIFEID